MADVFISYSRKDKEFVQKLHAALEQAGRDAWVDWAGIAPTAEWWEEIKLGIEKSDTFVFILSPASVGSKVCTEEIDHAVKRNKRLVPIVCRDVKPQDVHSDLARLNWLFFRESDDFAATFQTLLKVIDTDLAHVKAHTRLLVKAIEWDTQGHDPSFLLQGTDLQAAAQWLSQAESEPRPAPLHTQYIVESGKAEAARREAENKRQKRLLWGVGLALVVSSMLGILAFGQYKQAQDHQREAEKGEIDALVASAEARYALGQEFDALLVSLQAAKKLQAADWVADEIEVKSSVLDALQSSLYSIRERNRLEGHKNGVFDIDFSPDGQTIVTASSDGTAKLWQLDGTLLTTLQGHKGFVWDVEFSPDGKTIASLGSDGTVKLWQLDGTLVTNLEVGKYINGFCNINFSPDSKLIATASRDNTAKLWQLDGKLTTALKGHTDLINNIKFSPDNQIIATASEDKTAKLWRVDGSLITTLKGHTDLVSQVKFSPDGQIIATASNDKTAKLWHLDGTLIKTLGHEGVIRDISFSPDGQTIATASEDKTAKLWRLDGTLIETLKHEGIALDISFSPDNQTIATIDNGKGVKLWYKEGTLRSNLSHNNGISKASFSPDGQTLAAVSRVGQTVRIWNLENSLIKVLPVSLSQSVINNVSFDPAGQVITTINEEGAIQLWTTDGKVIATLINQGGEEVLVGLGDDDQTLVTRGNGSIKLWHWDGKPIKTLIEKNEAPINMAVSPDGRLLATAIENGPVQLWGIDGTLKHTSIEQIERPIGVSFSSDGQTLVTGIGYWNEDLDYHGPVQLWKIDGTLIGTLIEKEKSQGYAWLEADFSSNGQTLVTKISNADFSGPIKLWKADGTLIKTLIERSQKFAEVQFSAEGDIFVTQQSDGPIKLWQVDGTEINNIIGSSEGVVDFSLSLDGQRLVTISNKSAKLWDTTDGRLINTLLKASEGFVNAGVSSVGGIAEIVFSPDGQQFIVTNPNRLGIWDLDGKLIEVLTEDISFLGMGMFSPDSKMLAIPITDSKVKIWHWDSGLVTNIAIPNELRGGTFSPDNKRLLIGDEYRIVIRDLEEVTDIEALVTRGCDWVADYLRTNPNLDKEERQLCEGVGSEK
ncbi:MAG: TIR domain-containing protein [Cyanothece sp. SIO1E1]|nr:TIR domain-containing protein [Cyanothece sp. SIO1E1]